MKCPKIICVWGSIPDSAWGAYDALPDLVVGWGGVPPPNSSPLDAFYHCSLTFVHVGTGRNDGHTNFLNMAVPMGHSTLVRTVNRLHSHRVVVKAFFRGRGRYRGRISEARQRQLRPRRERQRRRDRGKAVWCRGEAEIKARRAKAPKTNRY